MLRKTILTILLVFLFIIVVLYSGSNLFSINDMFKRLVMTRIQAAVGEECSVGSIRLGFGSLNLKAVHLTFPGAPYEMDIEELQLGYSIKSLLKAHRTPEKTADEITVYQPRLTLLYDPLKSLDKEVDLSLQLSSEAEKLYRSAIKEYDFIKRMTISDGELQFRNTETGEVRRLAKRINGWAYADDDNRAWLRLAGNLFDTQEYNMVMYGQLDLKRGGVDYVNVDLHSYEPGAEIPFLLPDYVKVRSGQIDGHLTITERTEPTRGFNIEGTVSLTDGSFQVTSENLYFEEVQLKTQIKDWNIEILSATQTINGSPTRITGRVTDVLDPHFDLRLTSERLNVGQFLEQFLPQKRFPFKGTTAIEASVTGAFSAPRVQGKVTSEKLHFYSHQLRDLQVELAVEQGKLHFNSVHGDLDLASFTGTGTIDFTVPEKLLDFDIEAHADFAQELTKLGFSSADSCVASSKLRVFGSVLRPVSTGDVALKLFKTAEPTLSLDGTANYSQNTFVLNLSSEQEEFHLHTGIEDPFGEPKYNILITNMETLFKYHDNPFLAYLRSRYNLNASVEGVASNLQVTVNGSKLANYERVFHIESRSDFTLGSKKSTGEFVLLPNSQAANGSFEIVWNQDRADVKKLEIENWLTGALHVPIASPERATGKLSISGMSLPVLISVLGKEETDGFKGDIYGQIILGEKSRPSHFRGSLWLLDGFLNNMGPVRGQIAFEGNDKIISVNKLSLKDAENLNIVGEGQYEFATQKVDAILAGAGLRVEDMLELLADQGDVVAGEAIVQVHLKGKLPQVPLYGNVIVHDARILMLNFDEILLDFGNESNGNGSYVSNRALNVGSTQIRKDDAFVLEGSAYLPLRGGIPLGIDLSGEGNFLALLPDMAEVFEDSKSTGRLDLQMTGGYKTPDFTGSKLSFADGELFLNSVAKEIKNLSGDLEVEADDYFLNIKQLEGTIRGESFAIANTRAPDTLNHSVYESLRLGGDDLNLGALTITTSRRGLPLHIPGLMDGGEIGWYTLEGYSEDERFFIAGPWSHPYVRGTVRVRDANLMFPFDESIGEPNPIVMNIIDNINWDVRAVSVKGARYVRQFPAGIYVNMEVDPNVSMLEFSGILEDTSSFTIGGKVESTRGEIEYLDLNFRVEKVGAEFIRSSLYPIVYGKAWTVVRDSTNVPSDVYLTLFTVDDVTHQEVESGRWDRINIKLSSEHPGFDETQGDVMATLGYSSDTIDEQARKAVGISTDKMLFRPLLRPLERQLERKLQLDVVRFSYSIAQNFLDSRFSNEALGSSLAFLRSSRLMLGKYLPGDVYVLYTGEIKTGIDYQYSDKGVGLQHSLGLEYRLDKKWLIQAEYDYNTLLETHKDDKKIWLRHSFPLEN